MYLPDFSDEIKIKSKEISRPGLHLSGYFDFFDNRRIQIIGRIEYSYLNTLVFDEKKKALDDFFSHKPCVVILTKSIGFCKDIADIIEV
ncbi:MAG: HPr kinase/phosphorylase, partial [Lentisphaeria bacterium]|nr:HPr kinase/phosphorylase [Lentisphaeria bacterium]